MPKFINMAKETKAELVERVENTFLELADSPDIERAHIEADNLIAEFVEKLGYKDIANAYRRINKWYS